jgi:hypothetical protein
MSGYVRIIQDMSDNERLEQVLPGLFLLRQVNIGYFSLG